ncbi:putative tRNA (guanine-N(7)-)-methyltransferase non-catalytic subunit WDR4 [Iris pallida]|uniref:tRNA (guanine-N(7)-)-methyltransferase non-catalytic subunit n=1 Tax=Iris pallida TaxID=29817 RepID=A0AAX6IHG1_IRIPA|nr:putative tRNA (guanine-N(7)-)-methyltransferase non-catalytic subunit WDR4 [Iris pallida]
MDEEEASMEAAESSSMDVAPALIALHPLETYVAVAVGSELRLFDLQEKHSVSLSDNTGGPSHSDAIRAICFGAKGRLFVSAGDDKLVKLWATDSWHCVRTICSEKRVTAVSISHDGQFVTYADKFGVVWIMDLDEDGNSEAVADKKAIPLLGHYCSIITSLEISPDGRFIVSADRDFKIRITMFPGKPLKLAHEIQSFCLGHTDFVSCLSFVCSPDYSEGFLLSGSGDATVRLWDYKSGCLLDTCEVGEKAGFVDSKEIEKEVSPVVTNIHAFPDGSLVAVAIQSLNGVMLLKCEFSTKTLYFLKTVYMEGSFIPTSLGLSPSAKQLWVVMGASNLPSPGSTQLLARVRVISGLDHFVLKPHGCDPIILEDEDVPGGEDLLRKLQGSLDASKEEVTLAATASALKASMHNLLIKKQYSAEKRELRKRSRNDRKQKQ